MMLASGNHGGAFAIGAVVMFFLFSHASEFIDVTGRLHMVMILGVMGLFAVVAAGSLPRSFSTPAGMWLTLFTGWLVVSIPFSSWRGESFRNVTGLWIKCYIVFFFACGLIFTVEQCRKAISWLAVATAAVLVIAFRSGVTAAEDNRFSVTYGSLGNSNDLAGVLLMGVPFLLYVVTDKRRNAIARIAALICNGLLLMVVLRTGSRGAIFAIAAMIGIAFIKTSAGNKLKIVVLCAVLLVAAPLLISKSVLARYATILHSDVSSSTTVEAASAIDSTNARRSLMKNGVTLTLRHPIFGVGIGNFSHQSANLFIARGEFPLWFTCHDIYLLVSSETGLPGFTMYMAVIVVTFKSLFRMQKTARDTPELKEIANLSFCIMISLVAYLVCGIFSTSAYSTSLPMVAGFAAALEHIAKPYIEARQSSQPLQFASAPFVRRTAPAIRIPQAPTPAFRS